MTTRKPKDADDLRLKYSTENIGFYEQRDFHASNNRHDFDTVVVGRSNRGRGTTSSRVFGRGLLTPFFIKPNVVIRPNIIADKLPLQMKYGRNILTQNNLIDCRIEVTNIPPTGYHRLFTRKGTAPAQNVGIKLLTRQVGQKEAIVHPLRWVGVADRPVILSELPNDGSPFPLHFLQIRLDDNGVMIADSPNEKQIHYLTPAEYDLWVEASNKRGYLGRFKVPEDLIAIAKKPKDVLYAIQSGGYAAYLEKTADELVLNCEGTITDGELSGMSLMYGPTRILRNGKPFIPKHGV